MNVGRLMIILLTIALSCLFLTAVSCSCDDDDDDDDDGQTMDDDELPVGDDDDDTVPTDDDDDDAPTNYRLDKIWSTGDGTMFVAANKYVGSTYYDESAAYVFTGAGWEINNKWDDRNLKSVWGFTDENVYMVGYSNPEGGSATGFVTQFDGSGWADAASIDDMMLFDVWGSAVDDIYVVGRHYANTDYSSVILHYDGDIWQDLNVEFDKGLNAVYGYSSTEVFVVGDEIVLLWDGAAWQELDTGFDDYSFTGIWGASAVNTYVIGVDNNTFSDEIILFYDGANWTELAEGQNDWGQLSDIHGISDSQAVTVGVNWYGQATWELEGVILFYEGADWQLYQNIKGNRLYGVWAFAADDIFAVGQKEWNEGQNREALVLHYDGYDWTEVAGLPQN